MSRLVLGNRPTMREVLIVAAMVALVTAAALHAALASGRAAGIDLPRLTPATAPDMTAQTYTPEEAP